MSNYPSSGIDLKDVIGSDNKLNLFINNSILDPDLATIPKVGPATIKELKRVKIYTTNDLMSKLLNLKLDYVQCVEWLGQTISYTQSKQIVDVMLYRMEMMGIVVPPVPDNWRKLNRYGQEYTE